MLFRVLVLAAVCAVAVSAVPVSRRRLEAVRSASLVETAINPAAPLLSGSFHVKYSVFVFNSESGLLPSVMNWIDRASKLLDGEAWQNTNTDGSVTIKTVTTPSLVGSILTPAMTQVWVKNHGWTQKSGTCTPDTVNAQLVIPGTILQQSGVFAKTFDMKPILAIAGRRAKPDGTYSVDQWDATLPDGAGKVSYYLFSGTKTPMMSHYELTGKPAVWAQYVVFEPLTNPDSTYVPTPDCAAAAGQGAAAPATTTLAKLTAVAAAAHTPAQKWVQKGTQWVKAPAGPAVPPAAPKAVSAVPPAPIKKIVN